MKIKEGYKIQPISLLTSASEMVVVRFRYRSLDPTRKESLSATEYGADLASELRQTTRKKSLETFNTTPWK